MPRKLPNINISLYLNSFVLALCVVHILVVHFFYEIPWFHAAIDGIITYISIYQIAFAVHYFWNRNFGKYAQIFIIILESILVSIIWYYLYNWLVTYFYADNFQYLTFWEMSKYIRVAMAWVVISNFLVILYLSQNLNEEAEEQIRTNYNEKLKKDAELLKLRQQINPHFLFNSLNSVNALIQVAPERAKKMIEQMSEYFRNTLKKEDENWSTVQQEMQDIELYFEIEKVRFGHRLDLHKEINSDCLNYLMPPFLLQPLIENAIKYGLYSILGYTFIHIKVDILHTNEDFLMINISNPFDSTATPPKGTGFGLAFIQRRLFLLFSRKDLLNTQITNYKTDKNPSVDALYQVNLLIPLKT